MGSIVTGANLSPMNTGAWASKMNSSKLMIRACCAPTFLSKVSITNVMGANTVGFGTYPAGHYFVTCCYGSFNYGGAVTNSWSCTRAPSYFPPISSGWFIQVAYNNGLALAQSNEPVPPGGYAYTSQALAQQAAAGCLYSFYHTGGTIGMAYAEVYYADDCVGSPPPTFALYAAAPFFALVGIGDAYGLPELVTRTGLNSYSGNFSIRNFTVYNSQATFTLKATGGIINPSAPVSLTYTGYQAQTASFTWNAYPTGNVQPVARIGVTLPNGTVLPDIVVNLSPKLAYVLNPPSYDYDAYLCWVTIENVGNCCTDQLVATLTAVSGATLVSGLGLTVVPSVVYDVGSINGWFGLGGTGASYVCLFYFTLNAGSAAATFLLTLADGTNVYASATVVAGIATLEVAMAPMAAEPNIDANAAQIDEDGNLIDQ